MLAEQRGALDLADAVGQLDRIADRQVLAACRMVDLDDGAVIGRLDDYRTRSGYVMTPVVMWADHVELVPNPAEVSHAYRIGVHELCRSDSPRTSSP